jgi:hypothetical protein
LAIILYIVVHLLDQLSKETVHKKASSCWPRVVNFPRQNLATLDLNSHPQVPRVPLLHHQLYGLRCYGAGAVRSATNSLHQDQDQSLLRCQELSGGQVTKTWHFTSILKPHELNRYFFRLAFHRDTDRQIHNIERALINVVGNWIKRQILRKDPALVLNLFSKFASVGCASVIFKFGLPVRAHASSSLDN